MADGQAVLHNVTYYARKSDFERLRVFYKDVLDLQVVFAEPDHISCVAAGGELGICVHEEEPGHPAGTRELFFYVDDYESFAERARSLGYDAEVKPLSTGTLELWLTDSQGNQVRCHRRPEN